MEKSKKNWEKLFLGVGIITVVSGIFLIVEGNYLIGTSGSIVGIWLVFQNIKQLKA